MRRYTDLPVAEKAIHSTTKTHVSSITYSVLYAIKRIYRILVPTTHAVVAHAIAVFNLNSEIFSEQKYFFIYSIAEYSQLLYCD